MKKAGVNYVLGSFYQIRRYKDQHAIDFIKCLNSYTHTIIDSGLFTLMFGAKKPYSTYRTNDYRLAK